MNYKIFLFTSFLFFSTIGKSQVIIESEKPFSVKELKGIHWSEVDGGLDDFILLSGYKRKIEKSDINKQSKPSEIDYEYSIIITNKIKDGISFSNNQIGDLIKEKSYEIRLSQEEYERLIKGVKFVNDYKFTDYNTNVKFSIRDEVVIEKSVDQNFKSQTHSISWSSSKVNPTVKNEKNVKYGLLMNVRYSGKYIGEIERKKELKPTHKFLIMEPRKFVEYLKSFQEETIGLTN